MTEPCAVSLYLDMGRNTISAVNDLNVRPFIREAGMEPDNVIDCNVTRQVIVMSDCAFIIIQDHDHVLDPVLPACHIGPFYNDGEHYYHLTPPCANMLIVMHSSESVIGCSLRDIRKEEFKCVAECIVECVLFFQNLLLDAHSCHRVDQSNKLFSGIICQQQQR